MRGLRWQDVDLDKRELHVRQRADRFNAIGKPKSEAGERIVPLPPMIVNTLREWRLASPRPLTGDVASDGEAIREEMKPSQLVFPNLKGKIETIAKIVNRGLHPAQIAAGVTVTVTGADGEPVTKVKYSGLHALRHFYASCCINRKQDGGLGLPPKMVQERLGHSTIALTMNTYSHLFPRADDANEMASAEAALLR